VRLWLVNPFDPLPGDPEQEGRYATLARLLVDRGHAVTWWTSAFSHRFKRPVDQQAIEAECRRIGFDPRFLSAPPYWGNVSRARRRNHAVLAREFARASRAEADRPAVVLASAPPPGLARAAVEFAREAGARSVVDVQDLWPENFARLLPRVARPLFNLKVWPWWRTARQAYQLADAIVGVADAYVERALAVGGPKAHTATIPLGVDLAVFDAAAQAGRSDRFTRPAGEVWLAYTGSLNISYDPLTILHATADLRGRPVPPFRLFITGRGRLQAEAERIVRERRLENVTLTGFLEFNEWAYLVSQCEVGFNASFPEALIYLPNKIFYYLAAGLAVLNTIPGQAGRIVRDGACGLDYEAGNVASCAAAIERLLTEPDARQAMGRAARRLAETTYDRAVLYPKYVALLEGIAEP